MKPFQRYHAMLDGKPVDHAPRIPILMQYAADYIGAPYGAFCSDYRVKAEANFRCAEDFGIDLLDVMSDPYSETEGFGAEIIFADKGVPRCPHPPLSGTRDLGVLKRPDPAVSVRLVNTIRTIETYHGRAAGTYPIMGWVEGPAAEASDLRGCSEFLMDLVDDPAWCEKLMDLCVDVAIDFARAQVKAGADTIGIGDAIASQISPGMYEALVLPREAKLVESIRSLGARVRLHICGDITHLLPGIAKLPLDILDVDHMVDMVETRKTIPRRVALAGNIDPVQVLRGTPEAIREKVRATYEAVGNPFLVNAGCEIPPGTPEENLRAICEPLSGP